MARHARRLILWTAGALLSLLLLAMLGIALVVWGINPDVFRGRIERAATDALGRRVELTGALRWRPGLNFQIESHGGRIANAEGFGSTPLASWQMLRMGVALRPLLDHRLVVDRIELQGLQLHLARTALGTNWNLRSASPGQQGEEGAALTLGSLRLRDGAVSFSNEITGGAWSAGGIEFDVEMPAQLNAPALRFSNLSLRARLHGSPVESAGAAIELQLPRIDVDRAQERISIADWRLAWNDVKFSGAIKAEIGDKPAAEGSLHIEAPSLRRLMQSVSVAAPVTRDVSVFGALSLQTRFAAAEGGISLTQLDARLDATRLAGQVKLPTIAPLSLRFELAGDQLDMDRYLAPEDAPGKPFELPLAMLRSLDAKGMLTIRRATLAGAAAREIRIDVD